jgi:hypothetical protein
LRPALPILIAAGWALALAATAQTSGPDAHAAAASPAPSPPAAHAAGSSPARTPSAERYKAQHGVHANHAKTHRYHDYRMGTKSGHHGGRVCSEQAGHRVCEWR